MNQKIKLKISYFYLSKLQTHLFNRLRQRRKRLQSFKFKFKKLGNSLSIEIPSQLEDGDWMKELTGLEL